MRISEVLALRHKDIDWENNRIEVTGTLIDDVDQWHLVRQNELKSREQARYIDVPHFGMRALEEARRVASSIPARLPDAPAVQGQAAGKWVHARNVRRSLRDLRDEKSVVDALAATGIEPSQLTPHTLRRTAATLVAASTGDIRQAQWLLGHSSEGTTKRAYAGSAWRVVGSATVLESLLGDEGKTA